VSEVFDDGSTEAEPGPSTDDVAPEAARRPKRGQPAHRDAELLVKRALDTVNSARPMPLSASVMINRDEVAELLEEAIARLPEELRAARWLLKEREEFLAKVRREGDDILEQARSRAERMVQRTEVVKAADVRARQIVERAEDEARRLRLETEDFCDRQLARFENILDRTQKVVGAGRAKLQGQGVAGLAPAEGAEAGAEDGAVFDQEA
jgi:F0F1-type ATP synthase membrane subunit b/b'